ncbi:MAG: hypothetical protein Q9172_003508 [Xanthocarpia lactea]
MTRYLRQCLPSVRLGVIKTYKLNYESAEIKHALFNRNAAKNNWRIGANILRSFLDYFGTGTEYLDIYTENGRVSFTSYTEKIMHGREILKHPLETSIALDKLDFEEFCVEEKMHLAISIKDFRAIVSHAETLQTNVQAYYSFPTRPIQLTYSENGVACELTLMTIGDYQGSSLTPAPISVRGSSATPSRPSRQAFIQPREDNVNQVANEQRKEIMPPPSQPASRSFRPESLSQRPSRPSPPPPKASLDPESLFLPAGDDDRQWDERNFEDEEDILGWDVSGNHVGRTLGYLIHCSHRLRFQGCA